MKKIFITGVAGTGKTTVLEELQKRGFYAIGIDEVKGLCSWVNKETQEKVQKEVELNREFTSKHSWVCDVSYLKKLMNKDAELIFVVGITSNQNEFIDLFDKVLLLQCRPEIFLDRLTTRTNNDFGKDKAIQDHMLEWYESFEERLLKKGAVSINSENPIAEVVDEILKKI